MVQLPLQQQQQRMLAEAAGCNMYVILSSLQGMSYLGTFLWPMVQLWWLGMHVQHLPSFSS